MICIEATTGPPTEAQTTTPAASTLRAPTQTVEATAAPNTTVGITTIDTTIAPTITTSAVTTMVTTTAPTTTTTTTTVATTVSTTTEGGTTPTPHPCDSGQHNCSVNEDCVPRGNSNRYTCECSHGYEFNGTACEENECVMGNHTCHANADCDNRPGRNHNCTCRPNFHGDGRECNRLVLVYISIVIINPEYADVHTNPAREAALLRYILRLLWNLFSFITRGATNILVSINIVYVREGSVVVGVEFNVTEPDVPMLKDMVMNMTELGNLTLDANRTLVGDNESAIDVAPEECLDGTHNCSENATCQETYEGFTCTCMDDFLGNGTHCEPNPCPGLDGYVPFGDNCYLFGNTTTDYPGAEQDCRDNSGRLARVFDSETHLFFVDYIETYTDQATSYWIGLDDRVVEGQFNYSDGTALGSFNRWSNLTLHNQDDRDCVLMAKGLTQPWDWVPQRCSDPDYRYICEYVPTTTTAAPTTVATNATTVITVPSSTATPFTCPGLSAYVPFNRSCYLFSNISTDYAGAENLCSQYDGRLIRVMNNETHQFLLNHILTYINQSVSFWIGLEDIMAEGVFVYSDGSPLGSFHRFPADFANEAGQDCVLMATGLTPRWDWWTDDCLDDHRFICEYIFDPCRSSPCDPKANCTNIDELNYSCECFDGYQGDGLNCTEIDECLSDPCDINANCTNTNGSFTCQCIVGYEGDGFNCTDEDECQTSPCHTNANCTNTIGSYMCACQVGYEGDGFNCTDINECLNTTCHDNATCVNTDGSYYCQCLVGYAGDGLNCTDIDECDVYPCDENATCTNTDGSFTCECVSGYEGNGFNCTDEDECLYDPCHANATCTNTDGSYTCMCNHNSY
ncbi:uncharacterized protein LOC118424349 [Branchiostoma floridae]|uniref:Uncharacterized protein LOC118424349 n=1 Tax=Branchiostoma floridae TaxID=7739 RepID=A0A9J7N3J5_BRAFL|nr:uncharacterized protein LOC118424349 [Branchiostoma floridae]